MTYIVYLVLLTAFTPAPQFMILDDFKTMSECQTAITTYVKVSKLTPDQAKKLMCMPLITSPLTEPL